MKTILDWFQRRKPTALEKACDEACNCRGGACRQNGNCRCESCACAECCTQADTHAACCG